MRKLWFAAMAVFVSLTTLAQGLVSVDEGKLHAVLKGNSTVVSVPITNNSAVSIRADLSLEWLTSRDDNSKPIRRTVTLLPGMSNIDVDYRIEDPSIWTRLRYLVEPESQPPISGIVSLSRIAEHVFEIHASYVGTARRNKAITIHAEALHPISRVPVSGVVWTAKLKVDDREIAARRIVPSTKGNAFTDFVFDIPAESGDDPDDEAEVEITARKGDFEQDVDLNLRFWGRMSGLIQTDKPIYQPGQTLHFRAILSNPEGRPASGAKVILRIEDEDNDRVHTVPLTASVRGIVQDDWALPASATLGTYKVEVLDEKDSRIAFHGVRVSRYELPTFRVTATPDRPAYLPGQRARVTISGQYLFGKPVPKGLVKIVKSDDRFSRRRPKKDDAEDIVATGEAASDGTFSAEVDLSEEHEDIKDSSRRRYKDASFAVYFTDTSSNRTEQSRFDLRVTREPIHIYVIRSDQGGSLPAALYISTSNPDGRPASATVQIEYSGRAISMRTNAGGIGKAMLLDGEKADGLKLRATDAAGQTGVWEESYWSSGTQLFRLNVDRTIYRAGEAVELRLQAPPESPATQDVMVHAIVGENRVATRIVHLANHQGRVTFPYQPEFRRAVIFVAWNGSDSRGDYRFKTLGTRTVIFPDRSDLNVFVSSNRTEYKPGSNATVQARVTDGNGKPQAAVLGLAIVDQAVLERARTDADFGKGRWFRCAFCVDPENAAIGEVRLGDLYRLKDDTKITPELDLAAEALVAQSMNLVANESSESVNQHPTFRIVEEQKKQIDSALEINFANSGEFPRDPASLKKILGALWTDLRDPWGVPYAPEFDIVRQQYELTLTSAGPDKKLGTADDFAAITLGRPFFAQMERDVSQVLRSEIDFPETEDALYRLLGTHNVGLQDSQDPWNRSYRVKMAVWQAARRITIQSAGPDGVFESSDDLLVANFSGTYFRSTTNVISNVLSEHAEHPPRSGEEFQSILDAAGIPMTTYRDPWNHPYRVVPITSSRYADRTRASTQQVFGQVATRKTEIIPVTQKVLTIYLRSDGPDGMKNTGDDFNVASFYIVLAEESAQNSAKVTSGAIPFTQAGGGVFGTVTDATGAVVANVKVLLKNMAQELAEAVTDERGEYYFIGLAPGVYSLSVDAPGFKSHTVEGVLVTPTNGAQMDVALEVGSTTESITVSSDVPMLMTESASLSYAAEFGTVAGGRLDATSTPRVRDYFPETLLWLPELVTNGSGEASHQFRVADNVTTWKIAAFASTQDGRTAEGIGEFRTFQPFFLDFQPPLVLSEGDQVTVPVTLRNYTKRAQKVAVDLQSNGAIGIDAPRTKSVEVAAHASVNVDYSIHAQKASENVQVRAIGNANGKGDAIGRIIRVHPDGQQVTHTDGDLLVDRTSFRVPIPANAIESETRGEIRIYPNAVSLLLESATAILETPHGCAEQTISAGYANLIAWRFAKAAGIVDPRIEKRALANVRLSADGLNQFTSYDGSVSYWATDTSDTAVTAYALQFLADAGHKPEDLEDKISWLLKKQTPDGSWLAREPRQDADGKQSLLLASAVVRALSAARKVGASVPDAALERAFAHIAKVANSIDEPYLLANFVLAALDSGNQRLLGNAAARLAGLAREERGTVYWDLQTNTPFYGWGTAGRFETTGVVITALSAWRGVNAADSRLDDLIRRGLVFLLRGRDASGNWYSTQSTLRAMHAIADAADVLGPLGGQGGSIELRSNGRVVKTLDLHRDNKATDPILLDVSSLLTSSDNQLELTGKGSAAAVVRLATSYWLPWNQTTPRTSPELRLSLAYDRLEALPAQPVRGTVHAERVGFRGNGMMLAEIGLPPAAEVDRASLEEVVEDGTKGLDHYEILPDRLILYLWPKAGGAAFDFFLTARTPMQAKTGVSVLYDYNNPEALSEVAPFTWRVTR